MLYLGAIRAFAGILFAYLGKQTDRTRDIALAAAQERVERRKALRDIAIAESGFRFSATILGRWFIVVPFGIWWAALWLTQIGGLHNHIVIETPPDEWVVMARELIPWILGFDALQTGTRVAHRYFNRPHTGG